jgi:hypothetical protein
VPDPDEGAQNSAFVQSQKPRIDQNLPKFALEQSRAQDPHQWAESINRLPRELTPALRQLSPSAQSVLSDAAKTKSLDEFILDAKKYIKNASEESLETLYKTLRKPYVQILDGLEFNNAVKSGASQEEITERSRKVKPHADDIKAESGSKAAEDYINKYCFAGLSPQQKQDAMRALASVGVDQNLLRSLGQQNQMDMERLEDILKLGAVERMLETLGKLKSVTTEIQDKGETPQRTSEQNQHFTELAKLVGGSVVNEIKGDPEKASADGLKDAFYKHYELWTELNNGQLEKVRPLKTAQA